jgi:hypothetical protein
MISDLSILSSVELQSLFTKENRRFLDGINSNMGFDDLKLVRLDIRKIFDEMLKRKMPVQLHDSTLR